MNKPTTAALTADWLENAAQAAYVPSVTSPTSTNRVSIGGNLWPYYGDPRPATYWTTTYTEPRKIRLKLSEVERLRAAAKDDKKLKEVLQKFTGHIEIEVDFE